MKQRAAKPEKMSWVVPYLMVADSSITVQFYQDHFGFEILSTAKNEHGKIFHAELRYKDIVLMCGNADSYGETTKILAHDCPVPPIMLYLYHDDVDALYESLKAKGVIIDAAPENQFWGDRILRLTDKDGHQWSFATNIKDHD